MDYRKRQATVDMLYDAVCSHEAECVGKIPDDVRERVVDSIREELEEAFELLSELSDRRAHARKIGGGP